MTHFNDLSCFGEKYFDWKRSYLEKQNFDNLTKNLKQDNYKFCQMLSLKDKDESEYLLKISIRMEDEWTHFFYNNQIHLYFKSESDKIMAVLIR